MTLATIVNRIRADQPTKALTALSGITTSTICCMISGAERPTAADSALRVNARIMGFFCFRI
ncbi:hypothetical protein D3C71_2089290 [compost metagenome]